MPELFRIYLGLEHADKGQVTVKLVIIETVADDEFIGHFKTRIFCINGGCSARGLIHKRCDGYGCRLSRHQIALQIIECVAAVEDILDNYNVAAFDILAEIFLE